MPSQRHSPKGKTRTEAHGIELESYNLARLHPLMAAAYRNRTESPLCRLPDKILVRMMQLADTVTVECLRRCSRLFLRLSPLAFRTPVDHETMTANYHSWPTPRLPWPPGGKAEFLSLLERDAYCKDCLAARQSPGWSDRVAALVQTYLHCSACNADHPACLFSAKERSKSQSERICIGHEGYLRLCKHKTMNWHLLCSEAKRWRRGYFAEAHGLPYHNILRCKRHLTSCNYHARSVLALFRRAPDLGLYDCSSTPTASCVLRPSDLGAKKPVIELEMSWSDHIPIRKSQEGRVRAEDVAKGTGMLYEKQGRFVCPQLNPGQIPGARICDPGYCDCLQYQGMTSTAWERPSPDWQTKETCRTAPMGFAYQVPSRQENILQHSGDHKCFGDQLGRTILPEGRYIRSVKIAVCPKGKHCLVVAYQSWFRLEADPKSRVQRMNWHWYQVLDPDSYSLTEDTDGFGMYWCKNEACRNYYRFMQSRIGLLKPTECVRTCPSQELGSDTSEPTHAESTPTVPWSPMTPLRNEARLTKRVLGRLFSHNN